MVHFYYRISIFLVGVIFGILLGKFFINVQEDKHIIHSSSQNYNTWFNENRLTRKNVLWDNLRYNKNIKYRIESNFLFEKISIVCVVLLKNTKNKKPIENTWTKGCNAVKFVNIEKSKTVSIRRNLEKSSWVRLCQALQDVEGFDWILIVSDYSFVIMENLRYFLAPFTPTNRYYFGHTLEFWTTFYNSKESGIVLSRGTLKTFQNAVTNTKCASLLYWNKEDYYLGKTLASLGIKPTDTRDTYGFSRFQPFYLHALFFNDGHHQVKSSVFPFKCCSKNSVSFLAPDADKMYTYYYLLYTVQLFTYGNFGNIPNLQDEDYQVWQSFLRERNVSHEKITSFTSEEYYKVWEQLIHDPTSFAAKMKMDMEYNKEI